jgi:hypothetical protein
MMKEGKTPAAVEEVEVGSPQGTGEAKKKNGHKPKISFDFNVTKLSYMEHPNEPMTVSEDRDVSSLAIGSISGTISGDSKPTRPSLQSGARMNMAHPEDVESLSSRQHKKSVVTGRDIVRIFTSDTEYTEVSPEQLERVKGMHRRMEEGATFTFNYNTLLFVASVLAGLGLVSNSGATIIASMLVSPIMGPVVGLAYGSTIRDWNLVKKSFRTEVLSLLFCITMGVAIASITGPTQLSDNWPTPVSRLISRPDPQSRMIGRNVVYLHHSISDAVLQYPSSIALSLYRSIDPSRK